MGAIVHVGYGGSGYGRVKDGYGKPKVFTMAIVMINMGLTLSYWLG